MVQPSRAESHGSSVPLRQLVAQASPAPACEAAAPDEAGPDQVLPSSLRMVVPAEATAPWLARERFYAWLTALHWPAVAVDDVVFAVSEAVSNSCEHAYPPGTPDPVVTITAVLEHVPGNGTEGTAAPGDERGGRAGGSGDQRAQRLRIRVRDHGSWRPAPPEPGLRGRGLQMMAVLMDGVTIDLHSGACPPGTEITLVSPIVVPAAEA